MVDPAQASRVIDAIEREYGQGSIRFGNEEANVTRIPTGSLELDWATGGGIPMGRISRLWGGQSSGKSLVCWNVIRNAQAQGLTCAYWNIEKQYDPAYTKKLGVDIDKMMEVPGTVIEEIGGKLESMLGVCHIHVLDSASSAVSVDELNSKPEEWQMGLHARAWGKVLRRCLERMSNTENAIILVDQARDSFGYGGGEHPPGGRFMEHSSSLTLYFRKGVWLYRDAEGFLHPEDKTKRGTMSGMKEADGFEFQVRVMKSRVGPPLRTARMYYDFANTAFDSTLEYVKAAKWFNVVQQNGAFYTLSDGTKIHGENKLRQRIHDDKALRTEIKKAVAKET